MATYQGGSNNDAITGSTGADTIHGGGGDDTLSGGSGNDLILGGVGNDIARFRGVFADYTITWDAVARQFRVQHRLPAQDGLDLVSGVELFQFADGIRQVSTIVPSARAGDLVDGTAASELLLGGLGYDTVDGGLGNDRLDGREADDTLSGGEGNDTLVAGNGNDRLDGGTGLDTAQFRGSHASYAIDWNATTRLYTVRDLLAGRDGIDVVTGVERFQFSDGMRTVATLVAGAGDGVVLQGSFADETLVGGEGYDSLSGGGGKDVLDGQASNDTLEGGNSEDLLVGGGGNDSLDGGEGVDRAVFSGFFADYDVTWDAPTGQYKLVHRLGSDGIDVVKGVEQFQFADGIRDAAMLVPGSGAVLVGTAASDTLVGGDGADRVQGLEGVDQLDGRGGDDTLEGGAGNDNLFGGGGKDLLVGGEGIDTAYFMGASWQYDISWNAATREYTIAHRSGSEGIDVLTGVEQFAFADGQRDWSNLVPGMGDGVVASGTAGDDSMFGGAGYDLLQGNDGRDVINGWLSADTLEGGAGDDQLAGGAGNDSLVGGEGKDAARYSGASWEYDIAWNAATRAYTIAHRQGADGIDLVRGVELFAFADGLRDWATLVPGAGDGLVQEGGAGHDYLWGSAGYDLLRGNDGSDLIDGWGANDTLDGGNGDDRLTGGAGNDTLIGGAGMDVARYDGYAWQYDIRWDAATRAYTIAHRQGQAQDGVDVVSGVELFGFADGMRDWGNLVPGAGDGVTLEGGLAGDTLTGSAGYDALRGNDGHDLLDGGSGADTLDGGNGDDRLLGGTGNDTLSGGAGMDVAQFLGTSWDYDISWDAVTRQYTLAHRLGHDGVDVVAGVEQFAFADGIRDWGNLVPGAGDGLVLQGTEADEAFASSAGYDLVDGAGGNDILNGQGGADTLIGGDGDDFLSGGSGNDSLAGGAGVDTAQFAGFLSDFQVSWDAASSTFTFTDRVGGEGADVLSGIELVSIGGYTMPIHSFVPGMGLQLTGTATNDWLVGSHNDDTLLGLEGADWLEGDDGNDTLAGGDGIDRLAGGGGNDVLTGGAGADLAAFRGTRWDYDIRWDAGARHYTVRDLVAGRDGTDTVSGAEQFEFVDGNRDWGNLVSGAGEGVVLEGTAGNDELRGGAGYDLLRGGDGYDWLDGGSANDTLFGGASEDRMVGGAGQDVFVFDTHADSMPDWIYDFQHGLDRIQLDADWFAGLPVRGAVPYAAFQAGHGPWAQGSEIRIVYDTYSGALYHDPDGLGGAEAVQFATLQTAGVAPALSASDLFVA